MATKTKKAVSITQRVQICTYTYNPHVRGPTFLTRSTRIMSPFLTFFQFRLLLFISIESPVQNALSYQDELVVTRNLSSFFSPGKFTGIIMCVAGNGVCMVTLHLPIVASSVCLEGVQSVARPLTIPFFTTAHGRKNSQYIPHIISPANVITAKMMRAVRENALIKLL